MDKNTVIREMTASDLDDISAMERENFSTPWKRADFEDLLDKPDRGCVVAEEDGRVIGCIVYRNIVGDVDISNVQVKEAFRCRGVGALLMKTAMERARAVGGTQFTLEVRESNHAAITLYEKMGFIAEGKRRGFYDHPKEDAVIMWMRGPA